jgi:hypothetical protein
MPTVDECRRKAEECLRWADEADSQRETLLEIARLWTQMELSSAPLAPERLRSELLARSQSDWRLARSSPLEVHRPFEFPAFGSIARPNLSFRPRTLERTEDSVAVDARPALGVLSAAVCLPCFPSASQSPLGQGLDTGSHRSTHTTAYDMVAWSFLSYSCTSCALAFSQLVIVLNGTACTTSIWPANVTISSAPLIVSILLLRDFFYFNKPFWFSSSPNLVESPANREF